MKMRVDVEFKILQVAVKGPQYKVDHVQEICPVCHFAGSMLILNCHVGLDERLKLSGDLQVVYVCPRQACQRLCIVHYSKISGSMEGVFGLVGVYPFKPRPEDLPREAAQVSPEFEATYQQALEAEVSGLDRIAGIGYRRSLEFLIKDYLARRVMEKDERARLMALPLGKCIHQHVQNSNIKEAAKRATWLGNDEAHYVRKWPQKDISDLKRLIKITASWIAMELTSEQYQQDMPEDE